MKKISIFIITFILALILLFLIFWCSSIIKCEYLTIRHGYQFKETHKQNTMIGIPTDYKVLTYSDDYAEIYYVSPDGGDVLGFKKNNGEWKQDKWITVWSSSGTADDYIWPYGR